MGTNDGGMLAILAEVNAAKAVAATATTKAAKKRAYRAAMVAAKRKIVHAILAKDVRTTGAFVRSGTLGRNGMLFLADYDRPAGKAKARATK